MAPLRHAAGPSSRQAVRLYQRISSGIISAVRVNSQRV